MPIYAYRCSACGFAQDKLRKMSDPPLTECPECGQDTFVKQVTAAGFQLKGSGWYVTDFRDNGAKPAAPANGATALSGDSAASSDKVASTDSAASSDKGSASEKGSSSAPASNADSAKPAATSATPPAKAPAPTP